MRYKRQNQANPQGEYDACYYEISLDESVLDEYNAKKIHVKISEKSEMNVYLYGGKSRFEATESIIDGNNQANVGQTYSIGVDKGILIVAYPNENVDTEFGFEYWLEAELKPTEGQVIIEEDKVQVTNFFAQKNEEQEEESAESDNYIENLDNNLFYGLCAGAGVLLLAIIALCYQCRNNKQKVKHESNDSDQNVLSGPSSEDCKENQKAESLEIVGMVDDEE